METYIQTTEYTTAACSLMMILNHYKGFELTRDNEFRVWRETVNLPTRASSIYGLAVFAKKQGLEPKIMVGEKEYDYPDYRFKGYTKKEVDEAKFSSKQHHKQARELEIPIEVKEFDLGLVKQLIKEGKVIFLRVNAGALRDTNTTSNYVVVYSYEDNFSMVDPVQGQIEVGEEKLKKAFETLVTESKRDNRMIIF